MFELTNLQLKIIHFLLILIDMDLSHDEMYPMAFDHYLVYHDLLAIHKYVYDDEIPLNSLIS